VPTSSSDQILSSNAGPLVSVFVQVYNTESYVRGCIESVLAQHFTGSLEVIVIDDGSTDGSWNQICQIQDPRIHAIRHDPNLGANATANEGYGLCRGEFILRLDSDDRLRPGFLRESLKLMGSSDRIGFTFGDIALIDGAGAVTSKAGNVRRPCGPVVRNELMHLLKINYVPAPTTLVRRAAVAPLLPVPQSYAFLDWYLTLGMSEAWDAGFLEDPLAEYRVHSGNGHPGIVRSGEDERICFELLDRHFSLPSQATAKSEQRRQIYSSVCRDLGNKYFGLAMSRDALRMFLRAAYFTPSQLFDPQLLRLIFGATIGARTYSRVKRLLFGRVLPGGKT
jgi:glycosyltransferase involved in cell wall biosynthesis